MRSERALGADVAAILPVYRADIAVDDEDVKKSVDKKRRYFERTRLAVRFGLHDGMLQATGERWPSRVSDLHAFDKWQ